jgi:bifunctional non-homologous end joining protein LigD
MSLKEYRSKRQFRKTTEPKGAVAKARPKRVFVVHEHHASVMHFDLRLEIDGVLKSWSVPKGPSLDPDIKRLAVEVEDHPLEYASFNGTIPEGQYGAGRSLIWDEGLVNFEDPNPKEAWEDGRLSFELNGTILRGAFALVRTNVEARKPQWLLLKKKDEFAEKKWRLTLLEGDRRFKEGRQPKAMPSAHSSSPKSKTHSSSGSTGNAMQVDAFLKQPRLEGNTTLRIGAKLLALSHLDKVYWPRDGITKGDLIRYCLILGETMIPYLKGRPAILRRFPNGISKPGFVQHSLSPSESKVETITLENERGRSLNYAVYTDVASLVYLANLGAIEQHAWLSRIDRLDRPDYVVFDLDLKKPPFANVLEVAVLMREALESRGLKTFVKTSGSSGLHVFVPIRRAFSFERVGNWAKEVSEEVASRNPKVATTERRLAARKSGQVYIDYQQNARGKSIAMPYSVRPRDGATVSTPVTWDEVATGFEIRDFTIETVPPRVSRVGDLWEGLLNVKQSLV